MNDTMEQDGMLDKYYSEREFVDEDIRELLPVVTPAPGHVEVTLLTHYRLAYDGAKLGITGSSEELGKWTNPKTMTKCFNGWWAVKMSIPKMASLEAKLVIHVQSDPREIIYWELEGRRHRVFNVGSKSLAILLPWDKDEVYKVIANKANKRKKKLRMPGESSSEASLEVNWTEIEKDVSSTKLNGTWRMILCIAVPAMIIGGAFIYLGKAKLSVSDIP